MKAVFSILDEPFYYRPTIIPLGYQLFRLLQYIFL